MNISDEKILMSEVAILYYEKKHTQQEIAEAMGLSRQTVSKLLNDAIKEKIVEIKIHNPKKDCEELEKLICERFSINKCIVCGYINITLFFKSLPYCISLTPCSNSCHFENRRFLKRNIISVS